MTDQCARKVLRLSTWLLLSAGSAAAAQTAPTAQRDARDTAAAPTPSADDIIVTGTLLRRTDRETVSPVTVLTADQLSRAGITTIADAVRSISADNSGSIPVAFTNGFAQGASGVSLRGLTVNSTLVLIDGLRTANYALADDGQRGFVDLNTIPQSLVERVEVLKDGASSTYGADAIGGVVNLIMRKTFTGVTGTVEGGGAQHGGAAEFRFDVTGGTGDLDRQGYNVYLNVEYQHDSDIRTRQRPFPFNTNNLSSIGGNNLDAGIPGLGGATSAIVQPATLGTPGNILTGQPVVRADGSNALFQPLNPNGCGRGTFTVTDPTLGTYCEQNVAGQYGTIQPRQDRLGVTGRFTAKLGDDVQGYVSASYYQDIVQFTGTPFGVRSTTPVNTTNIALPPILANGQLNPNDPFAAQGQYALLQYAFGDIPQNNETFNHVFRAVGGIDGDIKGWHFAVDLTAAHTWLDVTNSGYINIPGLFNAINTGSYNFVDPSQNSPAVRAALSPTVSKQSTTDLDQFQATVSRSLFDLPGGPLQLAVGTSFRYEQTTDPDINPNQQTLALGEVFTKGHHYVTSAFFEVGAPVLKSVEINLSGRYDHYSEPFNRFSPKIGVKFEPVKQIALRGTYSRGFRAPSFSENGKSGNTGFINFTPPADFQALHNNDAYVQQYALALTTGSNPAVKPELSESFTLGAVVAPTRWFNASVDYYDIQKTQVISGANPTTGLNAFFAGQPLPAGYSVTLDNVDPQAPGAPARPVAVLAPYFNAASLKTSGIDVDLNANFDLGGGFKFLSNANATWIFHYRFTPTGGDTQNYVGTQGPYALSSGAGTPRVRGSWQNSIDYNDADLTLTTYYVSGYRQTADDYGAGCISVDAAGNPFPANCRVRRFIDFDLTASYKVSKQLKLFVNVINLTDEKPPFDPANYAAVNYNPTWSQSGIIGRFFRAGLTFTY